jgi:hypothetical protein
MLRLKQLREKEEEKSGLVFKLRELLLTIAIIGVLAMLLLPVSSTTWKVTLEDKLKQISLALHTYTESNLEPLLYKAPLFSL